MIVGDTSWIVALRDPDDLHHTSTVAVDDSIDNESVLIAAITLTECLVAPGQLGKSDEAEAAFRAAFEVEEHDDSALRRWRADGP